MIDDENQTYRFVFRKTIMKRYVQMRACALYFAKKKKKRKDVIMKKLLSVLLSVMLCMCVMMSAPWNRCFATENPDDPVPCVDEGMGDNF